MATTSIHPSTGPIQIGVRNTGGNPFFGRVLWAQVEVGTSLIQTLFFDARNVPLGTADITDRNGNVWTLESDAEVTAYNSFQKTRRVPTSRKSNIAEYDDDGVERPTSALLIIGEGEGDESRLLFLDDPQGNFPRFEEKKTWKETSEDQILLDRGQAYLDERNKLVKELTVKMTVPSRPDPDELVVGDYTRVVIRDQDTQIDDSAYWIGRKRTTLSPESDELITLNVTTQ